MKRIFKKISFEQFKKDIINDENLYNHYLLPKRATKNSAGYDFYALEDMVIKPGAIKKIPTGIKAKMLDDEVLLLIVRSSMGFKYNVRLCNQVGVIDADYYNNANNEGHIWLALQNEGSNDYNIKKDEAICQGLFTKILLVDNDECATNTRVGGMGSTNKEEENE